MTIRVAILTVSDRCSRGVREDLSGPRLVGLVEKRGWQISARLIVPDEKEKIAETLLEWCAEGSVSLILTTGGTGLGPRDVTPEATRQVLEREIAGLGEVIRAEGRRQTPLACLSRMVAGTRGRTLILNLPGSPEGAAQSFEAVAGLVEHAVDMMHGKDHDSKEIHAPSG
jgi:molybdenum cofactor synthesis domain-containing protein